MIVLFTDFGVGSPYVGQLKAVLHHRAPGVPVIDLLADAPAHDPRAAAYLLGAFAPDFPEGSVFLGVVDPGVGSDRGAGVLLADGRWYVGPDNGLFELVARRARERVRWWRIVWRPERLSASFHGRDLFAPVAAAIAVGGAEDPGSWGEERAFGEMHRPDWPDDLGEIVYVDAFGNAMTGLRAHAGLNGRILKAGDRQLHQARTFSDVPAGQAFWYENSSGLVEIAVNGGRAERELGLSVGAPVSFSPARGEV